MYLRYIWRICWNAIKTSTFKFKLFDDFCTTVMQGMELTVYKPPLYADAVS